MLSAVIPPESSGVSENTAKVRLRISVRGAVQGVGFRPFTYRLASELRLTGWVNNSAEGVLIEAEADRATLEKFLHRMRVEKPTHCVIREIECAWLGPTGYSEFEIRASDNTADKTTLVLPDLATCPDCLRDIFDQSNRRFHYPFTNCTNCGPRFTIIKRLPYDRTNTSMREFVMCADCRREYEDPSDRRFHAQPNACPKCGPSMEIWNRQGRPVPWGGQALEAAARALREGAIVAVKGLGGFHLMAAAHQDDVIERLRFLKHREEKPFALMFPTVEQIRGQCEFSELERDLLCSHQAPIVLLRRRATTPNTEWNVSRLVAPGNPYLGVMLPYTPLHHLLLHALGFPVVATSGNLAEEPICIDENEAVRKLASIADLFLVHNRPIVRHADDSIVRVMAGREMVLRRARGYAPLPVRLLETPTPGAGGEEAAPADRVLAVGAHQKNAVALAIGQEVFISQHIGDLETAPAYAAFKRVIADLAGFYETKPGRLATDLHPDYLSTRYARTAGLPIVAVQHHYAHVLSCIAEHEIQGNVLGVSWDGTGMGLDGTIWGGEFLAITETSFERLAHLRTFPLPGGDRAAREPRRSALGLLYELMGDAAFDKQDSPLAGAFTATELAVLRKMLAHSLNTPTTSSVGRLFDGVAGLIGLRLRAAFEGQAAMELEFATEGFESDEAYPMSLRPPPGSADVPKEGCVLDWAAMLTRIMEDVQKGLPPGLISTKFHNGLVEGIVDIARIAGRKNVVLSGGCFQNKRLSERTVIRLRSAGFQPYWHHLVPPNDGGIALGQVLAARRSSAKKE